MFVAKLQVSAIKGRMSTEPFVGDNCEGILITCSLGMPLQSLRSKISGSPGDCHLLFPGNLLGNLLDLDLQIPRITTSHGDAKITQGHIVRSPGQHILWLDIVMDNVLVMSIL
jgi:hypothetical protein